MINLTYYEVGDVGGEDGRGSWYVIGRFTNWEDANTYSKKRGNYGQDADVKGPITLTVAENIQDIEESSKQGKIQGALKKLTDEEKQLLGQYFFDKEDAAQRGAGRPAY